MLSRGSSATRDGSLAILRIDECSDMPERRRRRSSDLREGAHRLIFLRRPLTVTLVPVSPITASISSSHALKIARATGFAVHVLPRTGEHERCRQDRCGRLKAPLADLGGTVLPSSPEEFGTLIARKPKNGAK
jgi:hypothetical protein